MRTGFRAVLTVMVVAILPLATSAAPGDWVAGVNLGAESGPGFQAHATVRDFTVGAPLSARLAVAYNKVGGGNPEAARHVFINDNTNGTPTESARCYQFRFDLLWELKSRTGNRVHVFFGPRFARYTAEYVYVGGNEDFEVRSSPWGLGVGLESAFAVGRRAEFVLQVGLDHFGRADLSGHDTTYAPDGVDINPRDGYDYGSADDAVDQPRTEILAMAGLQFPL